jgi:hypothetical protein
MAKKGASGDLLWFMRRTTPRVMGNGGITVALASIAQVPSKVNISEVAKRRSPRTSGLMAPRPCDEAIPQHPKAQTLVGLVILSTVNEPYSTELHINVSRVNYSLFRILIGF